MTAAIAVCAVLIIAVITGLYYEWRTRTRGPYEPRHVTRRALADPADTADPDGARFIAELHHEEGRPAPPGRERAVWQLGREAVAAAAAWPAPAGRLGMLPPDPPPADTAPLPVAVCELGMPTDQYLDELFAKYAEVTG